MGRGCLAPGRRKKKKAAEQGSCCLRAALRFPGPFPPAAGLLAAATSGGRTGRTLGSRCAGLLRPERRIQPRSRRSLQCAPDTTPRSRLTRFSGVLRSPNNNYSHSCAALTGSSGSLQSLISKVAQMEKKLL